VNYEGSYASLTQFVRSLDKSNRFLIIESLQAAPQPSGILSVNLKVDIFVRQPAGGIS
jgi:Tfp pilus assembly protein PilO